MPETIIQRPQRPLRSSRRRVAPVARTLAWTLVLWVVASAERPLVGQVVFEHGDPGNGKVGAPTPKAVRTAGNGVYTVSLADQDQSTCGTWTARTADLHEAGPDLNVLFGDGIPRTSDTTLRSWSSGRIYRTGQLRAGCLRFCSEGPSILERVDETDAQGFVMTWLVADGSGRDIEFVQEVIVEGPTDGTETVDNTVVRETHVVRNVGTREMRFGLRKHWDWQIGPDDGPWFGDCAEPTAACDRSLNLTPDGSQDGQYPDSYVINHAPEARWCPPGPPSGGACSPPPLYIVAGTVAGDSSLDPPPDPPDLLQFNSWPELIDDCWLPGLEDAALCDALGSPFDDTAIAYFYGTTASSALAVGPGEQMSFTQYVVAASSDCPSLIEPPTADCDAGGPYDEECQGELTSIPLDGEVSSDADDVELRWTTDCPGGTFDDATVEDPVLTLETEPCLVECSVTLMVMATAPDGQVTIELCSAPVTVRDELAPELDCPPEPLVVECRDGGARRDDPAVEAWRARAGASDACSEMAVPVTDDTPRLVRLGACPTIRPVTFRADDGCGNVATCLQDLMVEDTTPPELSCPEAGRASCADPEAGKDAWLASATAEDACSGERPVSARLLETDRPCADTVTETWEFTATDTCGHVATCTSTWTVADDDPPRFDQPLPSDETVECTDVLDAPPLTATDDCDDDVPVELSEERADGACAQSYTLTRTWTATDDCGNQARHVQVVEVADTEAPTFDQIPPADVTVECDAVPEPVSLTATDACDDDVPVVFAEERADGSCSHAYALTRTWTATDDCGNSSRHVQVVTVEDRSAPAFDQLLPFDATVECDAVPEAATLTATDTCDADVPVAFAEDREDGSCPDTYVLTRTWTATDDCGNETVAVQVVTVEDTTAPVFDQALPADATVECDGVPEAATPTASDACDDDVPVAFAEDREDGSCPDTYVLMRTWTATDDCGNSSRHVQVVTVEDTTAPSFDQALPADATVECDAVPPAATLTATDACDADVPVVLAEDREDGACPDAYVLTRTWTATDDCGNSSRHVQVVTVEDTTAPSFDQALPADATVECDAVPLAATLTATDACDDDVPVVLAEDREDGPCPDSYVLTRTWTAEDDCGNSSRHVQVVTVEDTTAPSFDQALPADATVECDAVPPATTLTATDACDADVPVVLAEEREDDACPDSYVLTRTWTAEDDCGNSSRHVQVVTVEDTTAPSFDQALPADATVECDAVPEAATLTATDACDDDVPVAFAEDREDGACPDAYVLTRTWTATDDCGNEAVHVQVVDVRDTEPPVLLGVPPDGRADCGDVPPPASVGVADDCDPAPVVEFVERRVDGRCADAYELRREWTARDRCGNESRAIQVLTVDDLIPPVPVALLLPHRPLPPDSLLPPSSPLGPRSPAPPRSACSSPSSATFLVHCEAADDCDPEPEVAARLLVAHHDVSGDDCVERIDVVDVDCGELVLIELLAPPCPARPPRSPRPSLSVRSDGSKVVTGESVVLEVVATDRCGNVATDRFDPAVEPDPECLEVLDDGTCCPVIAPPAPPKDCRSAPCP